ncbi:MAG: hypothetical protein AABZ50_02845 [Pseudomonadota bacterium]
MHPRYRREHPLTIASAMAAGAFWLGLLGVLLWLSDKYLPEYGMAFGLSAFVLFPILTYSTDALRRAGQVAWLHGHAVEITPKQFPDLHARLKQAARRLELAVPHAFLVRHAGHAPTWSLRLRGQRYLAIDAELVGTLTERQGAIDFYFGHELAWLADPLAAWRPLLYPATVLPLLGAALERARLFTGDRTGLAVCKTAVDAALALAVLASGSRRWKSFNIAAFTAQNAERVQLVPSLSEIVSPRPWLSRRIAELRTAANPSEAAYPPRHRFAYVLALFCPRLSRSPARFSLHALILLVWIVLGIGAHAGITYLLVLAEVLDPVESRIDNRVVAVGRHQTPAAAVTPSTTPADDKPADTNPYTRLNDDLRRLGDIAAERSAKLGGIACEVGPIQNLRLHYRAERYAFSCDEPLVYTVIEAGEFEPGRPSFLHNYNWRLKRFSPAVSGATPTKPTEPAGGE